jgi:hypothetical protein
MVGRALKRCSTFHFVYVTLRYFFLSTEVAKEQGWTRTKTLQHLVRKSGFNGGLAAALQNGFSMRRYQSSKLVSSLFRHFFY